MVILAVVSFLMICVVIVVEVVLTVIEVVAVMLGIVGLLIFFCRNMQAFDLFLLSIL